MADLPASRITQSRAFFSCRNRFCRTITSNIVLVKELKSSSVRYVYLFCYQSNTFRISWESFQQNHSLRYLRGL
ncbi:hypothetical protein X975_17764, partial [Stegodyphus mimosarum]